MQSAHSIRPPLPHIYEAAYRGTPKGSAVKPTPAHYFEESDEDNSPALTQRERQRQVVARPSGRGEHVPRRLDHDQRRAD